MNANVVGVGVENKSREEADRIMRKYPDRIPVLVTRNKNSANTPEIDKRKYLVPVDLTMGQLLFVIRRRLKMNAEKALFLFVDSAVVCNSELVSTVYYRSHDPQDGFLHAVYSCESVFGSTFPKVEPKAKRPYPLLGKVEQKAQRPYPLLGKVEQKAQRLEAQRQYPPF